MVKTRVAITTGGIVIAAVLAAKSQSYSRPGDNGPAIAATIDGPSNITLDHDGNLYVYEEPDGLSGFIRRVDSLTHTITTLGIAGCDDHDPNPKPPPIDCFSPLSHLAVGRSNQLLFSERFFGRIRSFDLKSHTVERIAREGPSDSASVGEPSCFGTDDSGNIFVCDERHRRILRLDSGTGIVSVVAGTGGRGFGGDHGPALAAQFGFLHGMAVDGAGNIYVGEGTEGKDSGTFGPVSYRIRRIDVKTGMIDTIAGTGKEVFWRDEFQGEGGAALKSDLLDAYGLTLDRLGNLVFINGESRICRIDLRSGKISTLAGISKAGFSGDGGLAIRARIDAYDLAIDFQNNLFIADWRNNRIRRVDAKTGIITTIAGNGGPHRKPPTYM